MNLDKIIELIAEQVAKEVLEEAEDHSDRGDEVGTATPWSIWRFVRALKPFGKIWLTSH